VRPTRAPIPNLPSVLPRARIVLLVTVLAACASSTVALAGSPDHTVRVPVPSNPSPLPPAPAPIPPPSGPCADPAVRCPDLTLRPPSDLRITRTRSGRVLLGSRNKLVNRGSGPLFLLGRRNGPSTMRVRQRIYSASGAHREYLLADTRFDFWFIPGQGHYWKLRDGLRFELWTAGDPIERFVERGHKTRFCMRDLLQVPGLPGPRERKFGGCNQDSSIRAVRMGISVGWEESYPPGYFQQDIDVTGLRGCYSLRHIADPLQHVYESDESNNMASVRIRLPGGGRC
jgi:hypothetical protein